VLDGEVGRRYFTANIGTELGMSTITGGTGAAAGRSRGGWVQTLDERAGGFFPQRISSSFSTSNPQIKQQQLSAGGQLLNW
jgi:hypothetical protein